jgi:hypothetical protein
MAKAKRTLKRKQLTGKARLATRLAENHEAELARLKEEVVAVETANTDYRAMQEMFNLVFVEELREKVLAITATEPAVIQRQMMELYNEGVDAIVDACRDQG